uniref:Metal tolerance protein 1 n=1 Tax=Anthurium amnicola TaxID=1678845 RepID=A0A1D1Y4Z5_9ARAE
MEVQNPQLQAPLSGQCIEIDADLPLEKTSLVGKRICGGAACGFSDFSTISKDAKEQSVSMRKLLMAVVLCGIFMSVEVTGGIKANSLAILTDAAHLLSDVAAFAISLFSIWAAGWEATPRQSYGFFRIEILGALVSIQLIWLLAGILVFQAISRIIHDRGEVQGFLMFAVSAFGLVVNIIMAALLGHDHTHSKHDHDHGHGKHRHSHDHDRSHDDHGHDHTHDVKHSHCHGEKDDNHAHDLEQNNVYDHDCDLSIPTHNHHSVQDSHKDEHEPLLKQASDVENPQTGSNGKKGKHRNINVHSAYLHVLGDSIQSIGVMISGAIIWYRPELKIIDLICTLVFSVIVLVTTVKMLRNILEVLMESTPREIDAKNLEKGLCQLHGVVAVHELHVWAITVGKVLLACHVTITPDANADHVLHMVVDYIRREYNITHVTIQIERSFR